MHLSDADAREEQALCGADASPHDLTGVDEYLGRRMDSLPVGKVCVPCKVHAVRLAENRILELEADATELLVRADELERMEAGYQAERDAARHRNSAERRRSEADGPEGEARELRGLVERLRRETGL